jgi:hypothetical protein
MSLIPYEEENLKLEGKKYEMHDELLTRRVTFLWVILYIYQGVLVGRVVMLSREEKGNEKNGGGGRTQSDRAILTSPCLVRRLMRPTSTVVMLSVGHLIHQPYSTTGSYIRRSSLLEPQGIIL